MYQNGARIKGYLRKRLHKRKMKDRISEKVSNSKDSWSAVKEYYPYYWKEYFLSERRKYAKRTTNRAIRQEFNDMYGKIVFDEYELNNNLNAYRRYCDYNWEVF